MRVSWLASVVIAFACGGDASGSLDAGMDAEAGGDANLIIDGAYEGGAVCGDAMSMLPPWATSFTPTTEIYVSPTGNDANDGSSTAKAIQTVAHAVSLFKPGVRLNFGAGTYPAGVLVQSFAGSTQTPGVIRSSDGPLAAKFQGGFFFSQVKGIVVDGVEITTSTGHGFQIDSGATFNPSNLSTDIAIIHSSIHDSALANIKVAQSNHITVIANTFHNASPSRFNVEFVAASYVIVAGNDGSGAAGFDEIKGGAKDSVIFANVVHDISSGILVGGNCTGKQFLVDSSIDYEAINLRVWGNVIYNLAAGAYAFAYVGCQSCTVANNTVYTTQPLAKTIRVLDDGFGDPNNAGACTLPVQNKSLVLRNNAFQAPFQYMFNVSADLIGTGVLVFDHNLYFTAGTADVTTTYTDVPFTGDATSLYNVDPKLASPPLDMHLSPGSKAIGVGVAISDIPSNAAGACWTTLPNIGAY